MKFLEKLADNKTFAASVMLLACIIWGSSFAITKMLMDTMPALNMVASRNLIAGFLLLSLTRKYNKREALIGAQLGFLLFLALWMQAEGVSETSANRAAFLANMTVLVVPFAALFFGKQIKTNIWFACVLAVFGMFVLFYEGGGWSFGDTLIAISTLVYSAYIILMDVKLEIKSGEVRRLNLISIAGWQAVATGGFATIGVVATTGNVIDTWYQFAGMTGSTWFWLLLVTVTSSAMAPTMQIWAQQKIGAVKSSLIYVSEPVFAMMFAFALLGEFFSGVAYIGVVIIIVACFISISDKSRT